MVIGLIIGLIIVLCRTTYMAYDLYKKNRQLILLNQDIIDSYKYLSDAWYDLASDNDILMEKIEGLKREANLYWEDRLSLMNTVKILQGDTNVQ